MAKKVDAKALKEKKQKKMAIILLVVMLAVMAFSIPKTLKMMNQQPAAATPTPAAAPAPVDAAGAPAVPVSVDAGAAAVASAGEPTLVVSSAPGPAADGQLVSFERFESKDPFVQQIAPAKTQGASPVDAAAGAEGQKAGATGAVPAAGGTAPGAQPTGATPGAPASSGGTTGGATPAAGSGGSSSGEGDEVAAGPADPTSAQISVNGSAAETVAVEGSFPAAAPIFMLVELLPTGAEIAIVDGDYESGAETITLTVGRPLTLMNTSDGTRYEILLVSVT